MKFSRGSLAEFSTIFGHWIVTLARALLSAITTSDRAGAPCVPARPITIHCVRQTRQLTRSEHLITLRKGYTSLLFQEKNEGHFAFVPKKYYNSLGSLERSLMQTKNSDYVSYIPKNLKTGLFRPYSTGSSCLKAGGPELPSCSSYVATRLQLQSLS